MLLDEKSLLRNINMIKDNLMLLNSRHLVLN